MAPPVVARPCCCAPSPISIPTGAKCRWTDRRAPAWLLTPGADRSCTCRPNRTGGRTGSPPHANHWPDSLLQALGFDTTVLDWEISQLSSGERQRLALIRVLARSPRALLLDEPTANLDPDNSLAAEGLIADHQRQHHSAIIWVSHDPVQRARVADRTLEMVDGTLR